MQGVAQLEKAQQLVHVLSRLSGGSGEVVVATTTRTTDWRVNAEAEGRRRRAKKLLHRIGQPRQMGGAAAFSRVMRVQRGKPSLPEAAKEERAELERVEHGERLRLHRGVKRLTRRVRRRRPAEDGEAVGEAGDAMAQVARQLVLKQQ